MPRYSSVAVADPLNNNSIPIPKSSVNVDEYAPSIPQFPLVPVLIASQYEEIEVEEATKNREENSEGLAPLHEENHKKDGTHILEPVGLEEHLRSGISTPKQSVVNPDTTMLEEGSGSCRISNSDERREKNDSSLDGKRMVVLSDPQALRYSGKRITHVIQPFDHEASADIVNSDASSKEVIGAQFSEGGGHQEASEDLRQTSSRLDVPKIRLRSLSPADDSSGGNKRPADRSEFYSRSWCIKGRDPLTSHDNDGVLDAAKMKSKLIDGEGSKNTTERLAADCFSDLAPSAVRCGENQRLNSDIELHMHSDEHRSNIPFRDIERETLGCKSYLAGYGSSSSLLLKDDSLNKNSYHSGVLLSSSVLSSYKYQNAEVPSYSSVLDDTSYKRSQLILGNHHYPHLNHSVDRWPSYLTSSSNLDPVSDQKLLDHSRAYCSSRSISNKSSALPGSGTGPFSWTHLSRDMEHSRDYKTKVYFDDWKPSVPFQPSTFLSQIIPPPESLYDPIRDSIEQTSAAEKDLTADERETTDRATTHQENVNTSSKEEKHPRPVNPRGQKRTQSKLERPRHNYEIDNDFRRDGSVNYESGVLKHFRAALVEFVKELLKPTWHEGLLIRDAYKMIVKKSVDKVINSLQPDQIPDTTESIKQYLSVSKPKVAKLIEGYVEKYGKS
ncbi:protein FRIGIDA-ESSENTIAL 1-like isoform X1 [Nicotiana tomentosiformis]|uniref:protein FRIGIDA-ESSENTIAL 1-like isoform X1 n=2 Tax=Nicotiana tomentosiformis TaxID=4098 RepID=UPI00051B78AB|nr:protein FRIGIDA-ESSENTIAL 1-like isoform X1 [Nicotiana tomentosiformis]